LNECSHKRYFYIDIRDKEAPKSTWRFPPGEPISEEMSTLLQSVDIHKYTAPSSAPPPATRKITPAPVVKKDIETIKIQAKEPIVVHSDPTDLDFTYAKFLQQMHAGESPILGSVDLQSAEEESKTKLPSRPHRKAVPEYCPNLVQSEFIKQLSDLDLESSEAADILLKLAFPDIIMDLSDADYESLEEKSNSSSSGSSSSGHSSTDSSSSAWTLDL
jgi:hypothetical protein